MISQLVTRVTYVSRLCQDIWKSRESLVIMTRVPLVLIRRFRVYLILILNYKWAVYHNVLLYVRKYFSSTLLLFFISLVTVTNKRIYYGPVDGNLYRCLQMLANCNITSTLPTLLQANPEELKREFPHHMNITTPWK